MKRFIAMLLTFSFIFTFSSCSNKEPEEQLEASSQEISTSDYSKLLKMPVAYVRNSNELSELEYDRSMKNRFEAENLLPENHRAINKKTEDTGLLSVWNRSLTQIFIYGDGANEESLHADLAFFLHRGSLSFVFDAKALGESEDFFLIHEIYCADLNEDEAYEIYFNIETGIDKTHRVAGINLADKSLISFNSSKETYFHYFEDQLFLIEVPQDGGLADALCVSLVLENNELVSNKDSSQALNLAALSQWKENNK